MKPQIRQAAMIVWMGVLSVGVVAAVAGRAESGPATTSAQFDQVTVHRLNVVEPNGNPRVIISDRKEFPGLYWGGREYKHHSRDTGGFLFFNDDGDEVGGMTFSDRRKDGHYAADSGFTFDQYKQDQVVGLSYDDEDGRRAAGLKVWDRPNHPMGEIIEMSDQAARAATPGQKQAIEKKMMSKALSWGHYGERFFAGKADGQTVVRLADPQGRPRLLLVVDAKGDPSVEFLDGSGKVTKRITGN
ncbi:MAG TPA: hypothetical protein VFW10_18855 [Steroidobacteraceae bacterium]|nr:hypothetical protein [Steroidobacteraceae bacterium]